MSPARETPNLHDPNFRRGNASFVIRIWWEVRDQIEDPPVWRGRIEHVPSGRVVHFDDVEGLLDSIEHWTGRLAPDEKSRA